MSEIDRMFAEREAKRIEQERQRRQHRDAAAAFLAQFHADDVAVSKALAAHGISADLVDNRLLLHRAGAGMHADPFVITVGEAGEIDVAGRSLGLYTVGEKPRLKRELTLEILTFFDL